MGPCPSDTMTGTTKNVDNIHVARRIAAINANGQQRCPAHLSNLKVFMIIEKITAHMNM